MNIPLVSVIIPNYNHERYLERRIESIINQNFQDFEIIILDDCSTDRSVNIIERYRNNKKVHQIIYNKINSGSTFKQWMLGLNLCRAAYIWIAESDDAADPDFLMRSVEKLESSSTINCSFVESKWIDRENEVIAAPKHENFTNNELESSYFVRNKMLSGCYLYNASAVLFKRSAYLKYKEEIDFHLSKSKYSGDWLFWVYILKDGSVGLIYSFLNYFRRLDGSVSDKKKSELNVLIEMIFVIKQIKTLYNLKLTFAEKMLISNKLISFWDSYEPKDIAIFMKLILKSLSINILIAPLILLKKFKRLGKLDIRN